MKIEKVKERVSNRIRLQAAWRQIKKNAGAAGIDKMTVGEFEKEEERYIEGIEGKLKSGKYRFKPVRRVLIQKEGTKKKRKLGIPTVMDRIVSQSIKTVFEEIFEKEFTSTNYGFRRGKSQHQAIGKMREIVKEGYKWSVTIDLENYFDEIPHGLILKLVRRKIRDEKLVTLIARALKRGVIVEGKYAKTEEGVPQGSPLSPMISNIVLNELDQELEKRGHKYVRWADDFRILVKSERAGKRVKESVTRYLKEELGLRVNEEKSKVERSYKTEFLGFQIEKDKVRISTKSKKKFRKKVKELTRRNNPYSMNKIIEELNKYIRGWIEYYRVQEFQRPIQELDWYIRRRLRAMQLKKWKKTKKVQKELIKKGEKVERARKTYVKMNKWRSTRRRDIKFLLNPDWFRRLGLITLEKFTEQNLELKLSY